MWMELNYEENLNVLVDFYISPILNTWLICYLTFMP